MDREGHGFSRAVSAQIMGRALASEGFCSANPFSLISYYRIRNENPSNKYSCFPSVATDFTSPRRTC